MTIQEFNVNLKLFIDSNNNLRPFICDGSPLECNIFIVGINPATSLNKPFFNYYNLSVFDKKKWMIDYCESRRNKKTLISPTRKKIENLVNDIFGENKCLETNIYSYPSIDLKSLDNKFKSTEIINFLIDSIRPKALFIHGKNPSDFVKVKFHTIYSSQIFNNSKHIGTIYIAEWKFGRIVICEMKHLRLVSQNNLNVCATELLNKLRELD